LYRIIFFNLNIHKDAENVFCKIEIYFHVVNLTSFVEGLFDFSIKQKNYDKKLENNNILTLKLDIKTLL